MRTYRLSVRAGQSRDPALAVSGEGVAALRRSHRAVIMIHGFANSPAVAEQSYERLVAALSDNLWPTRPDRLAGFFGFHWPGDHRLPVVTQLSYATRVPAATASGQALGRLLADLPRTTEVILVAHSLGCRVLLAALEWLMSQASGHGARISGVYLLAAAVPVGECASPQRFAARHPDSRYVVLHSHRDRVLGLTFGPGQFLFERIAQAVGRYGAPDGDRWDQRVATGLGHSGYWRSPLIAERVARAVSPFGLHLLPVLPSYTGVVDEEAWQPLVNELDARHLP
ncbi:alpha/beta hydrolase [Dactylosporangium sp. NPDC049525]|uniref:alpha/beta hydrolase n=1 Tax=Dactylosporangium sp. NPDC049525 TaxID=3154730 RepID=UPI00342879E2